MAALVYGDLSRGQTVQRRRRRRSNGSSQQRPPNVLSTTSAILDAACRQNAGAIQEFPDADRRVVFIDNEGEETANAGSLTGLIRGASEAGRDRQTLWIMLCLLDMLSRSNADPIYLVPATAHRLVITAYDIAAAITCRLTGARCTSPLRETDLGERLRDTLLELLAEACGCAGGLRGDAAFMHILPTFISPAAQDKEPAVVPGVAHVGRQLEQILGHLRLRTLFQADNDTDRPPAAPTHVLPRMWSLTSRSPHTLALPMARLVTPSAVRSAEQPLQQPQVAPPLVPHRPQSPAASEGTQQSWGSASSPTARRRQASLFGPCGFLAPEEPEATVGAVVRMVTQPPARVIRQGSATSASSRSFVGRTSWESPSGRSSDDASMVSAVPSACTTVHSVGSLSSSSLAAFNAAPCSPHGGIPSECGLLQVATPPSTASVGSARARHNRRHLPSSPLTAYLPVPRTRSVPIE